MEENIKRVELFGGKHAFLEFVFDDDTAYIIRAYDDNKDVVACCYFDIEKLFQRQLSEEERLSQAGYFGGIDKTPMTAEIYVAKKDLPDFDIKGNILTANSNGENQQFFLKFAKCFLQSIEIKAKDYFKTGLGTILLKTMESFAIANDCFQIYARFQPFGDFGSGSRKFYERNGFQIEFDPCDHKQYATKPLPQKEKTTIASSNQSTAGKGK